MDENKRSTYQSVVSMQTQTRELILSVDNGLDGYTKHIKLPAFGEVRVITHGKDIRVETTTKEKVE